ncbi:DUF3040 domain-containing protein [Actinomadura sp. KC345]|uniref:DUF3040 domain-containing protein n=1 Tax=Actinomadura sp. KC345 TaxID=2530371 RepID=UPI00104909A6|nr:DUF3040 domain-containing protein [Actinomadura sp. KC345]TDC54889.1 DUF3040 domain-containing protein [Actinomadura sp. KC345]
MSLPLHESRVLALIEMGLCREDRELAERFEMFNRLSAPPRPEPSLRLCWVLTAAILVAVLVVGAIAAAVSG